MIIGTKGGHPDLQSMDVSRLSRREIRSDLSESLDRLGVDAVDIYWLHRDDPGIPVGEIIDVLEELGREGLVRCYGASNWPPRRLAEAHEHSLRTGAAGFSASQVAFSLGRLEPGFDRAGTIALDAEGWRYHRETRLPLFAYSSQAKGFFSGRYSRADRETLSAPSGPAVQAYFNEESFRRLDRVLELAVRLGREPNEVALAYLSSQPFGVVAIVGPRTAEQIRGSCRAGDLALEKPQVRYLESGREG